MSDQRSDAMHRERVAAGLDLDNQVRQTIAAEVMVDLLRDGYDVFRPKRRYPEPIGTADLAGSWGEMWKEES